jgi:hypothetical protein
VWVPAAVLRPFRLSIAFFACVCLRVGRQVGPAANLEASTGICPRLYPVGHLAGWMGPGQTGHPKAALPSIACRLLRLYLLGSLQPILT